MEMDTNVTGELVLFGVAAAPVIIGLVTVVKNATNMPTKYAPLLSVVFGLLLGLVLHLSRTSEHTLWAALFAGVISGLIACGLYSGVKAQAGGSADG